MSERFSESLNNLISYCKYEKFKGYDPYDGLNSSLFRSIPFMSSNRVARLAWMQFFKRLPVNLRRITGIKKEFNPKSLGLFLSGYCNLNKISPEQEHLEEIHFFIDQLKSQLNKEWSGDCWGYNFDWQARAFFQPKNTPTAVATTFISCALLDAFEITGEKELLQMARSSCEFILKDLNRTYNENENFAFSYSPLDNSVIFNASLLGSRLLARVYSITHEKELIESAERSVTFCCTHQHLDGSWSYGTADFHKWIDNFHTGYNLECISDYMKFSGDRKYENNLMNGFDYYIKTFFTEQGVSKYYNNITYPIDIHAPAQLIITLSRLGKLKQYKDLADKVLNWTIDNMQSEKGYFYFQKNRCITSRISYMRWAQAWMFYSLSEYLLQHNNGFELVK